jgi:hypothetical protein
MEHDPDTTPPDGSLSPLSGPGAAQRQALPIDTLLKWLTALFRSYEGCENVTAIRVTRLDVPDADGCNWSSSIVLDTAGVAAEIYGLAYAEVVTQTRKTCNLK